jgi:hypothetical protein
MTGARRVLSERRDRRARNSAAAQREFWGGRFDASETPVELLESAYWLLRTRSVQYLSKAEAAVRRARTGEAKRAAAARVEVARAEITDICGEAVAELERLADRIDTTRR